MGISARESGIQMVGNDVVTHIAVANNHIAMWLVLLSINKDIVVRSDVAVHIGMVVQLCVTLHLYRPSRHVIVRLQRMFRHCGGFQRGVSHLHFHRIQPKCHIVYKRYLRGAHAALVVITESHALTQRNTHLHSRAEDVEVIVMLALTVITTAAAKSCNVLQTLEESTRNLTKQILLATAEERLRLHVASIFIVREFLVVLRSCRQGEGLKPVFINYLTHQRPHAPFHIIYTWRAFVVGTAALCGDMGDGSRGSQLLMMSQVTVIINVECGRMLTSAVLTVCNAC